MVVDPKHRYSNESERANEDIYDDFKLKKKAFGLHGFWKNFAECYGIQHIKTGFSGERVKG